MDPRKVAFGFGRRICPGLFIILRRIRTLFCALMHFFPGIHFAEVSLILAMSAILAVFDIRKPIDENGQEYEPEIEYVTGITRFVLFRSIFRARFVS